MPSRRVKQKSNIDQIMSSRPQAGMATACSYRNSNMFYALADYAGLAAVCDELEAKGWTLADSFNRFNPNTSDTDNADLRRNAAGDCVLAFHGSDMYEIMGGAKHGNATAYAVTTRYGLAPAILTHYVDELDSITSLSLSRDSRCAKLLCECSRTARHAQASTELRLSMSCACALYMCMCAHLIELALIGFDVAVLPGTCSLTQRLKAFTLGTWQPSSLSTGEPAR